MELYPKSCQSYVRCVEEEDDDGEGIPAEPFVSFERRADGGTPSGFEQVVTYLRERFRPAPRRAPGLANVGLLACPARRRRRSSLSLLIPAEPQVAVHLDAQRLVARDAEALLL